MRTFMLHLIPAYVSEQQKRMTFMHTFVCYAVLRPSKHTLHVESVSEPSHTVHGQITLAVNQYSVHMFSPVYLVCHL